jgi:hypothetical protein
VDRQVCLAHCRHWHGGNPVCGRGVSPDALVAVDEKASGLTPLPQILLANPLRRPCRSTQAQRTCAVLRGRRPQDGVHDPVAGSLRGIAPVHMRMHGCFGARWNARILDVVLWRTPKTKRPRGGTRGRSRGLGEIGVTDLPWQEGQSMGVPASRR